MAIERHPFQFFLAGIADKLKGEDMAITFLHMDEDGYLDKTVSEITEAAENSIVVLVISENDSDYLNQIVYYYGYCVYQISQYKLMFFCADTVIDGTLSMYPYLFISADSDDYPQYFD